MGVFLMEAMRADQRNFLADQGVHRNISTGHDTDLHNATAWLHHREELLQHGANAGTFKADIEITLVSGIIRRQTIRLLCRIDRHIGSHCQRGFQGCFGNIHGNDFPGTGSPRRTDQQRTDRPDARHQNPLAKEAACLIDGMNPDGQRLGAGGFFNGNRITHRNALMFLGDQVATESTVTMRFAHGATEKLHVEAVLLLAGKTEFAMIAGTAGTDGNTLARTHTGDLGSHRLDRPGGLMPHDDRFGHTDRADAAFPVIVNIRTADPASAHAHQHLARPHFADFTLFDAQIFLRVQHTGFCFHFISSPKLN